jgi:hypothetical protein
MSAMSKLVDRLRRADPAWRAVIDNGIFSSLTGSSGPGVLKGNWYYVDPEFGNDGNPGTSPDSALQDILAAYGKCGDGTGDGIVLFGMGTTSANTTSYLKKTLVWAKSGITVVGIAAPTRIAGRARIANKDVVTTANVAISEQANSITRADAAGSFINDGWIVGMTGQIADSGSNNAATFTITAVTDTVLTVTETLNVQSAAQTVSCVLTSYCDHIIEVSGVNNSFVNVDMVNFGTLALGIGGVIVSGLRNYFGGCQFVGGGSPLAAAAAGIYDLLLNNAQENTFEECTFGTDTEIRSAATQANVKFTGTSAAVSNVRNRFYGCDFISYSATTTRGFINSGGVWSFVGVQVISRCRFMNWQPNGVGTNLASMFIGTKPTSGQLVLDTCSCMGVGAWDSVANKTVWNASGTATGAAAGGLGVAI